MGRISWLQSQSRRLAGGCHKNPHAFQSAASIGSARHSNIAADGCFEGLLVAHGFSIPFIVRLVRAGLATVHTERVVAGGRRLEVARVRITEAGRRAVAKPV